MQLSKHEQLVELKYCERCGELWLRAKGTAWVYCDPCKEEVAALPPMRTGGKRPVTLPVAIEKLQAAGVAAHACSSMLHKNRVVPGSQL